MRRALAIVAGALVGVVVGAGLTLALQARGAESRVPTLPGGFQPPVTRAAEPGTFLAWTAGGLPQGFRAKVRTLPGIDRVAVVDSDVVWMTRSLSDGGEVVDDAPQGYAIPLEVAAVDPAEYEPFVPLSQQGAIADLENGFGILGESSARLRRLGPGAVLQFGDLRVQVAAIWPDELVGAHELLVGHRVGSALGVTHARYALVQPEGSSDDRHVGRMLRAVLPRGVPLQVRSPGETPYFRQGDAVLPPVELKLLFGEFAARPDPGRPGYLQIDPAWEATHIATEHVPILGRVTCNVAMFPQIRGAIRELIDLGLRDTIDSFSGCYARRFANRDPEQGISHHTWGVAIDINVGSNPYGRPPDQDPRMVALFERWGFIWGGTFIRPDGMHFEWHRPPSETDPTLPAT
ncbi:MAG TPA: M15 family metallopeptidase [Actinomycetota bacterium]|nr:M15 family metallopeptidase [Actinomycetota bacterium]